jgi:hypothetical protein
MLRERGFLHQTERTKIWLERKPFDVRFWPKADMS